LFPKVTLYLLFNVFKSVGSVSSENFMRLVNMEGETSSLEVHEVRVDRPNRANELATEIT